MTIDTDNIDQLSDADLGALLTAAYEEQSRRSARATAVSTVTATAQEFVDAGGDKTLLVDAVQAVTPQADQQPAEQPA